MKIIHQWGDEADTVSFKKTDYPNAQLELGSGNGKFLTECALAEPDVTFFGIERLIKCINKTAKKADKRDLSNIICIHGDIFTAIERYFEPGFFSTIYINFPDPWFKKRHKKKRMVQTDSISLFHRYLLPEGLLYFVTDDREYARDGIAALSQFSGFSSRFPSPFYVNDLPDYPQTLYELKWRKEGKEIYYSVFIKK